MCEGLAEVGVNMDRATLARIEGARRGVSVDDMVQLAAVLNVSPSWLLVPEADDEEVAVTPEVVVSARWVRSWLSGMMALPLEGTDIDEFHAAGPPHERRRHRVLQHPAIGELTSLQTFMEEAIDRRHPEAAGTNVQTHPRAHAQAIRDFADRVRTYAYLLADEVERSAGDDEG